jgi:hypothetical protein
LNISVVKELVRLILGIVPWLGYEIIRIVMALAQPCEWLFRPLSTCIRVRLDGENPSSAPALSMICACLFRIARYGLRDCARVKCTVPHVGHGARE